MKNLPQTTRVQRLTLNPFSREGMMMKNSLYPSFAKRED
jgi:hypothetical protein